MGRRAHILTGGVALGALLLAAAPALAVEADEAETMDTIVVTATKREANVQDVPLSINVVSEKELQAFNISDLKGLANMTPSFQVIRSNSVNSVTLRGFGSGANNPAIDQTVALYVDGVFAGRARQYMAPFFDVSRVEILRGPQGALLGKNTAAGAVSVVTNDPKSSLGAELSVTYNSDRKGFETQGFVTGPIGDNIQFRLSGRYVDSEGWVKNLATGKKEPVEQSGSIRLAVAWQPTEHIDIVSKLQFDDLDIKGRPMAGFPLAQNYPAAIKLTKTDSGQGGLMDLDQQNGRRFSTTATFDIGEFTLVSVTGADRYRSYSVASASHADPVTFFSNFNEDFEQYSQEIRLLSPTGGRFDWIVGAYADTSEQQADNTIRYNGQFSIFNLNGQMTSRFHQDAKSISAFATGTWHVTDALRLVGGLRWTKVEKDGTYVLANDFGPNFIGAAPKSFAGSLTNKSTDPSVTVQYDITPDIMVYANWSKGSKGGTFQGANRSVTAATFMLKPEKSTNYEIGVKSQPFEWLTLNASAYKLEFKDLQTGQYVSGVLLTKNAGAARSQGVELQGTASLGKLRLDLSGAYQDVRYTDFPGAACTAPMIAAGCVNGVTPVNAAGRRFAFQPFVTGRGTVTYKTPVFTGLELTLMGSAYYSSDYFFDSGTFDPRIGEQDAYAKVDLRAELGSENGRWSVAVIGKNVTGEQTASGVYPWTFAPTPVAVYTIDEPESWAVQFRLRY